MARGTTSVLDQTQKSAVVFARCVMHSGTDIVGAGPHVSIVPTPDIGIPGTDQEFRLTRDFVFRFP